MKKSERCLAILEILQRQHKVTVTDLAQRFGISEMTIRRDLNFWLVNITSPELMEVLNWVISL